MMEKIVMYLMRKSQTAMDIVSGACGESYDVGFKAGFGEGLKESIKGNKNPKLNKKIDKAIKKTIYSKKNIK